MALFDEGTTIVPAPRRRMSRRTTVGVWALTVALFALLALTVLPTSFVIQRPGPVFNTLGSVQNSDGDTVPLIVVRPIGDERHVSGHVFLDGPQHLWIADAAEGERSGEWQYPAEV